MNWKCLQNRVNRNLYKLNYLKFNTIQILKKARKLKKNQNKHPKTKTLLCKNLFW